MFTSLTLARVLVQLLLLEASNLGSFVVFCPFEVLTEDKHLKHFHRDGKMFHSTSPPLKFNNSGLLFGRIPKTSSAIGKRELNLSQHYRILRSRLLWELTGRR
jgi:hypothetical protein